MSPQSSKNFPWERRESLCCHTLGLWSWSACVSFLKQVGNSMYFFQVFSFTFTIIADESIIWIFHLVQLTENPSFCHYPQFNTCMTFKNKSCNLFNPTELPPGFGGPHHSEEDIHVGPYKIPVGTDIFPDLLGFLRSEQYWEEPDTFDPTRFLGGNSMPFCNKNNFRLFFRLILGVVCWQ